MAHNIISNLSEHVLWPKKYFQYVKLKFLVSVKIFSWQWDWNKALVSPLNHWGKYDIYCRYENMLYAIWCVCRCIDGTWYHHVINISVFCFGINEAHYRCPFPPGAWEELDKLQRNTALTGCAVPTSYAVRTNEYVWLLVLKWQNIDKSMGLFPGTPKILLRCVLYCFVTDALTIYFFVYMLNIVEHLIIVVCSCVWKHSFIAWISYSWLYLFAWDDESGLCGFCREFVLRFYNSKGGCGGYFW